MALRPCIITLLIVYPFFLAAGVYFFRHITRARPHPDAGRNAQLKALRFMLYVVLMPVGSLLALAVLGVLDPLYHVIRSL